MKAKIHALLNAKRLWLFPLLLFLAAAIIVTILLLCAGSAPEETPSASPNAETQTESVSEAMSATEKTIAYSIHMAYMEGNDSFFMPDHILTRDEAVVLLSRLFGSDSAVVRSDGLPTDEPISREEFFAAICDAVSCKLPAEFAEEDAPYSVFALRSGWNAADADPASVSRGEATHILNRVTQRTPDREMLFREKPFIFVDVSPLCPYYCDIMEATIDHEFLSAGMAEQWNAEGLCYEQPESGLHCQNGIAYYVQEDGTLYTTPGLCDISVGTICIADESGRIYADNQLHTISDGVVLSRRNGTILKSESWNGYLFDENGYYTSGNEIIDAYVKQMISEVTEDSMTQEEKLRACYDYIYYNLDYQSNNDHPPIGADPSTWTEESMLRLIERGKGNCYCYASEMFYIARQLGYPGVTAVSGRFAVRLSDHAWTEITIDGVPYIVDPEADCKCNSTPGMFFLAQYGGTPYTFEK